MFRCTMSTWQMEKTKLRDEKWLHQEYHSTCKAEPGLEPRKNPKSWDLQSPCFNNSVTFHAKGEDDNSIVPCAYCPIMKLARMISNEGISYRQGPDSKYLPQKLALQIKCKPTMCAFSQILSAFEIPSFLPGAWTLWRPYMPHHSLRTYHMISTQGTLSYLNLMHERYGQEVAKCFYFNEDIVTEISGQGHSS